MNDRFLECVFVVLVAAVLVIGPVLLIGSAVRSTRATEARQVAAEIDTADKVRRLAERVEQIEQRMEALRQRVDSLRDALQRIRRDRTGNTGSAGVLNHSTPPLIISTP